MEASLDKVPIFSLSSRELGGAGALRAFRDVTANVFVARPDALVSDSDFRIDLRASHLGCVLFAETATVAQHFTRSRSMVASAAVDHIYVVLYAEGGSAGFIDGGRDFCARAGDICFFDLARPRETYSNDFRNLALLIPRALLEAQGIDTDALHGFVLKREQPQAQMLATHLAALAKQMGTLAPADAEALGSATVALVAALLARGVAAAVGSRTPLSTRRRLLRYIAANLGDPALGPARLMAEFGLSRAALYRMFESEGGVAEAIRARRLTRAALMLGAPDGPRERISEVARRLGFADDTGFSRAFRARFGIAPSHVRTQSTAFWANVRGAHDGDADLGRWIRNLRR